MKYLLLFILMILAFFIASIIVELLFRFFDAKAFLSSVGDSDEKI